MLIAFGTNVKSDARCKDFIYFFNINPFSWWNEIWQRGVSGWKILLKMKKNSNSFIHRLYPCAGLSRRDEVDSRRGGEGVWRKKNQQLLRTQSFRHSGVWTHHATLLERLFTSYINHPCACPHYELMVSPVFFTCQCSGPGGWGGDWIRSMVKHRHSGEGALPCCAVGLFRLGLRELVDTPLNHLLHPHIFQGTTAPLPLLLTEHVVKMLFPPLLLLPTHPHPLPHLFPHSCFLVPGCAALHPSPVDALPCSACLHLALCAPMRWECPPPFFPLPSLAPSSKRTAHAAEGNRGGARMCACFECGRVRSARLSRRERVVMSSPASRTIAASQRRPSALHPPLSSATNTNHERQPARRAEDAAITMRGWGEKENRRMWGRECSECVK